MFKQQIFNLIKTNFIKQTRKITIFIDIEKKQIVKHKEIVKIEKNKKYYKNVLIKKKGGGNNHFRR